MDDYMGLENNGEDRNTSNTVTQPHTRGSTFSCKNHKKGKNRHIFSEHATLQGGVLDI